MNKNALILLLLIFSFGSSLSQKNQHSSIKNKTISNLYSSTQNSGKTYFTNSSHETPRAIIFKHGAETITSVKLNLSAYLNVSSDFTFIETESNTDQLGMNHSYLQQYYKGIALEGMGYRIHERSGFVTSINGKGVRNITLDVRTQLEEESAFQLAVKYLSGKNNTYKPGKKLIVSKDFTFTQHSFRVAYQFDIEISLTEKWRVSIDANNGQLINKTTLVNHCFGEPSQSQFGIGTGLTNYYGQQPIRIEKFEDGGSRLYGQTENGGTIATLDFGNVNILALIFGFYNVYDFYSMDDRFNGPYLQAAVSVHWGAEQAFEYYFRKHNRNSFDNKGAPITSYVHIDQDYNNAFWSGSVLGFGDGLNNKPPVELDIVSHEFTHGVTQYEAQLYYYGESGALNESFSDILGKAVEFDVFGDTATWQLAKHLRDGGYRDMSNPNLQNQPDTYHGDLWFTGFEDNGGVHYNSGVQNYWYYLLSEGGAGVNDHGVNFSVNKIGMEAATNITYRNLTEYLTNFSDYLDSRIGSLLATADLYGANSTVYKEVDNAWDAVGVIDEPIITSLELFDITGTTAKIKGTMLPRADSATYHFEYGTTTALGNVTQEVKYIDRIEGILTELQSDVRYYLKVVATNKNGSSFYNTEFLTISLGPLVKIKQTVDVTENTATLYGEVNPNSLSTSFYFEYGTTPSLGQITSSYQLKDTTEFISVSVNVADLQPRKTYYYRLVAENAFESNKTESVIFFTATRPEIISFTPASAIVGEELTITGDNFNIQPDKNLVWFGAAMADVLSGSETQLNVRVPVGASFSTISVLDTESGLVANSIQEFVPAFVGGLTKTNIQLRVGVSDVFIYKALISDMDGNGKPDIVASHNGGFSVYMNVNQGEDISDQSFIRNSVALESYLTIVDIVDLDGNGLKDIVGFYGDYLRVYPNLSVPGFIFFDAPVDIPISFGVNPVFRDFDNDGHIDIMCTVILPELGTHLVLYRNKNPKGKIFANGFEPVYQLEAENYVESISSGDLNNDGLDELIYSSIDTDYFTILQNRGSPGNIDFERTIIQDTTRGRFVGYAIHDIDNDGWGDVISSSRYQTKNISVFRNKGTSNISLEAPSFIRSGYYNPYTKFGNMNGDSKVDFVVGTGRRDFDLLLNNFDPTKGLVEESFEEIEDFGLTIPSDGVQPDISINDLNGDGRPEIVMAYSYSYGPHDGYNMEIWQNSSSDCIDPTQIKLNVYKNSALVILPKNTSFDQFEIEVRFASNNNWWILNSTTVGSLWSGYSYQLRVRAKCYLAYSSYYYIDFTTSCVDIESFKVSSIGVNTVSLTANELYNFEVQYSKAGLEQWQTVPFVSQINNLSPGTTYDLRFRGLCNATSQYSYIQFTTLCPSISSITISNIQYNSALLSWLSNYTEPTIFEYSSNNTDWVLIEDSRTLSSLTSGISYNVRGKFACSDVTPTYTYTTFTTPCPKVSLITTENVTPFGMRIIWIDESQTGNYTVRYFNSNDGQKTTLQTQSTFLELEGLNPGTSYSIEVAVQCLAGLEFRIASFTTTCYEPDNLMVADITHTTAQVSWNDTFNNNYYVDYSIAGSENWQSTETSFRDHLFDKLWPGTNYQVRVYLHCPNVTPPYSLAEFTTKLYEQTTFAPNPTENRITIYPSKNVIGNRFSIWDNVGREVSKGVLLNYSIDLSDLNTGIYILKIEDENPIKIIKR